MDAVGAVQPQSAGWNRLRSACGGNTTPSSCCASLPLCPQEPAGRFADTWAAYIDFERRRGHMREARTLYKRCYT